jgi:predicted Zn finger-like uncharacterized protein
MKFKCEKCGTRYTIAEEKVRNRVLKIRCKVCEHVITVRDPEMAGGAEMVGAATPAPTGSAARRAVTASRAPALAPTPIGDDFPSDRTSVGDPLAPVSDVEWYCAPESGQQGPMPLERLRDMIRSGDVRAEDFVWNETMSDWVAASTVNVLGDLFRPKPPRLPPPPPPPPASRAPAIPLGEPAPEPVPIPVPAPVVLPPAPVAPAARTAGRPPPPPAEPDESPTRVEPALPTVAHETSRSELDVDLLSLLGPVTAAPIEASPTEMMPSSQAPTRPVENDELAALIAAEMAAPPTIQAPALAEQLSAAPTRALGSSGGVLRPAAAKKVDDAFGFGDLHDLPTALPASESGVHVVHDVPPPKRGVPMGLIVAAGLLLVVGGVGLGIWLAPQGAGPAVAAPPSAAAITAVAPTTPPTAPPTEAAPPSVASVPPSVASAPPSVASAPPSEAATPAGVAGAGGAAGANPLRAEANGTERPAVAARGPKSAPATAAPAATPSRPSAFAGLDAARGDQTPKLTPKAEKPGGDLPPGLDQVEISAVIKRNIKAVQGCYQRQLKRDDSVAEGRATIRFRIQSDGRAKDVSMDRRFDGSVLKQCIVNVVERWAFPPFEGDPIPVEFPVIFTATF